VGGAGWSYFKGLLSGEEYVLCRREPSQQPATPGRRSHGLPEAWGPAIEGVWYPALSMTAPFVCPGRWCPVSRQRTEAGLSDGSVARDHGAECFLADTAAYIGVLVRGRLRLTVSSRE